MKGNIFVIGAGPQTRCLAEAIQVSQGPELLSTVTVCSTNQNALDILKSDHPSINLTTSFESSKTAALILIAVRQDVHLYVKRELEAALQSVDSRNIPLIFHINQFAFELNLPCAKLLIPYLEGNRKLKGVFIAPGTIGWDKIEPKVADTMEPFHQIFGPVTVFATANKLAEIRDFQKKASTAFGKTAESLLKENSSLSAELTRSIIASLTNLQEIDEQQENMDQLKRMPNVPLRQNFLRTRDHLVVIKLLPESEITPEPVVSDVSFVKNGRYLQIVRNVLSKSECRQIIENSSPHEQKLNWHDKRSGYRMVGKDESLSNLLWTRIEPILTAELTKHNFSTIPLGFGVTAGEAVAKRHLNTLKPQTSLWTMTGVNDALRISRQGEGIDFFAPHYDAQYCASPSKRSLFSVIVYLTDEFTGGATKFHFRVVEDSGNAVVGLTVQEELDRCGGINGGSFETVQIKPQVGTAVIFSHDILHEAMVITPSSLENDHRIVEPHTRHVLRSDIIVEKGDGFIENDDAIHSVEVEEAEDYKMCLEYFRQAQRLELAGKEKAAGELYERCLSIRHAYPAKRLKIQLSVARSAKTVNHLKKLPANLLCIVGKILSPFELESLVLAFPALLWLQRFIKNFHETIFQQTKNVIFQQASFGTTKTVAFPIEFYEAHEDQCCRMAAMNAFFGVGNPENKNFAIAYSPLTHEVTTVNWHELMLSSFHNIPLNGCVFRVDYQSDNPEFSQETALEIFNQQADAKLLSTLFDSCLHGSLVHDNSEFPIDLYDEFASSSTKPPIVGYLGIERQVIAYEGKRNRVWYGHCSCGLGGGGLSEELSDEDEEITNETAFLKETNMVFDFSRGKLEVTNDDLKCRQCPSQAGDLSLFTSRRRVNVKPIRQSGAIQSFNHASCQCAMYNDDNWEENVEFDLKEWTETQFELKAEHLDHVHLEILKKDGIAKIAASYSAIAAL
ncbi:hypothetical protein HK100_010161 [Physocladia obscura]|uniref:Fe2OG dioxygenase domain-containing protein n=1 Tax=Physocladia obscura TaxID=109957 RepID=A0AAD5XI19_9FUNG|nr:hypothetical protein HK100_010161 [Physocladia obscura]